MVKTEVTLTIIVVGHLSCTRVTHLHRHAFSQTHQGVSALVKSEDWVVLVSPPYKCNQDDAAV